MNPIKLNVLRYISLFINIGMILKNTLQINDYRNGGMIYLFMIPEWMLFLQMVCALVLIYFTFWYKLPEKQLRPDVLDASGIQGKSNRTEVRSVYLLLALSIANWWTDFLLLLLRELWVH